MIFSVSTLFLVSLVFNAASTLGAPLKYRDTRSVKDQSPDTFGNFPPVALKLRSVSVVSERGTPLVPREQVKPEAREETLVRRYPRRVSYDRFEKREPEPEPATTVKESTVVITKVTTYDTPADAAGNGKPNESVTSTLLSSGFTTTLAPADPTATPSGVSLTPTTTPTPTVTPVTGSSSPSAVTPTSVPPTSTVADGPTPTATPSGGVVPLSPRSPAEGSIGALSTLDTAVPPPSQGMPPSGACLSCSAPDPPASSSADMLNGSDMSNHSHDDLNPVLGRREELLNLNGRQLASSGAAFASALRKRDLTSNTL